MGLLQVSEPALRSRFYEEVGLTGTFDPLTRSVEAVGDLGVRKVRVGGGTSPMTPRPQLSAVIDLGDPIEATGQNVKGRLDGMKPSAG